MDRERKRLHLRHFLPPTLCRELLFIHKSCGVAGYRPFVLSTTLLHLVATNCSSFIMPFIHVRDRLKELIEEHYGCEYELFVEFTGLMSWKKGAKIGWHSDNEKPYLRQRHFTAVCYLNNHADDFQGGLFHFQEGTPSTIIPTIGDVLIYKSGDVHCVDEVEDGERCTFALWFTLDSSFDEDVKILNSITKSQLSIQDVCHHQNTDNNYLPDDVVGMPLSAASSMYLVSFGNQESQRFSNIFSDLRVARIMESRFEIFVTIKDTVVALKDIPNQVTSEYFGDLQDALDKSVKIKLDGHEIPFIFKNAIHALQVLYFCEWKKHEMELTSGSLELKINHEEPKFENLWKIQEWNQYMNVCWSNLQRCYPTWKHQMCIGAIDP